MADERKTEDVGVHQHVALLQNHSMNTLISVVYIHGLPIFGAPSSGGSGMMRSKSLGFSHTETRVIML